MSAALARAPTLRHVIRRNAAPRLRAVRPPDSPAGRPAAINRSRHARAPVYFLEVESVGDIAVLRFACRQILTPEAVEAVSAQILALVEQEGYRRVVLNFSNLDRLATALLGRLINVHRRLRVLGGWLVLCRIPPHLYEIFAILRMRRLVGICAREPEALQTLQRRAV